MATIAAPTYAPHTARRNSNVPRRNELRELKRSSRIRIRLTAYEHHVLDEIADKIVEVAKRCGVPFSGPTRLPTRIERYTVLAGPHIDKKARNQYETRTHSRLIDIGANAQTIEALNKLTVPAGVEVKIKAMAAKSPSAGRQAVANRATTSAAIEAPRQPRGVHKEAERVVDPKVSGTVGGAPASAPGTADVPKYRRIDLQPLVMEAEMIKLGSDCVHTALLVVDQTHQSTSELASIDVWPAAGLASVEWRPRPSRENIVTEFARIVSELAQPGSSRRFEFDLTAIYGREAVAAVSSAAKHWIDSRRKRWNSGSEIPAEPLVYEGVQLTMEFGDVRRIVATSDTANGPTSIDFAGMSLSASNGPVYPSMVSLESTYGDLHLIVSGGAAFQNRIATNVIPDEFGLRLLRRAWKGIPAVVDVDDVSPKIHDEQLIALVRKASAEVLSG